MGRPSKAAAASAIKCNVCQDMKATWGDRTTKTPTLCEHCAKDMNNATTSDTKPYMYVGDRCKCGSGMKITWGQSSNGKKVRCGDCKIVVQRVTGKLASSNDDVQKLITDGSIQEEDVNLDASCCSSCGQKGRMRYAEPDCGKAKRCSACKLPGDVNVFETGCECGSGCKARWVKHGEKTPSKCKECIKSVTDINQYKSTSNTSNMCERCEEKRASFGFDTDVKKRWCKTCMEVVKKEKMEIKADVQVVHFSSLHLRCSNCKSKKLLMYAESYGKKPVRCGDCRKEEDVNVWNGVCECGTSQPIFGEVGTTKQLRCIKCKKPDDVALRQRMCPGDVNNGGCVADMRGNPKYDGYCTVCFEHLFPYDTRSAFIRKNRKELHMKDHLVTAFPDITFVHNKVLYTQQADCTVRRRIDFWVVINNTVLAIECDENQHKDRCPLDEEARLNELACQYDGKFVLIRFNPDLFKMEGQIQDIPLSYKYKVLNKTIREQMRRVQHGENKDIMEIIHLFFDE